MNNDEKLDIKELQKKWNKMKRNIRIEK